MSDRKNNPKNSKDAPKSGRQPDKADFYDDEFDVPTYDASKASDSPATSADKTTPDSAQQATAPEPHTTIFERAGRAAPQKIEPNSGANRGDNAQAQATAKAPAAEKGAAAEKSTATGNSSVAGDESPAAQDSAETTQFQQTQSQPQQESKDTVQAAAREDDRPEYRDEDFASTEIIDPAGKQTTVPVAESAVPRNAGQAQPVQQAPAQQAAGADAAPQYPAQQPYAQGSEVPEAAHEHGQGTNEPAVDYRRGTIDLGLFLLRIVFAGWLIIQGVGTFFGLGNYEGISGLEAEFSEYNQVHLLAILVPSLQLAAGIFLLLGLLAPFAAMVALTVTGFMAVHQIAVEQSGLNIFNWEPALWLPVIAAAIAVIVQFTGPGLYSLDGARAWARRPLASSWIFVVIGIAAVVAAWWLLAGTNPLAT